jgi:hypothetical protein
MWFLLLGFGAVLLATFGLPALGRLPVAPPPEVVLATYFLLAALLRLLVRQVRLAAWDRAARRRARVATPAAAKPPSGLGDLGLGVGKGVAQVVGGDLLGAGISVATGLLKGAAASLAARREKGERRPVRREAASALACIGAVGAVCIALAWLPLPRGAARAAGREGGAGAGGVLPIARARAAEHRGARPAPQLVAASAAPPAIATAAAAAPAPAPGPATRAPAASPEEPALESALAAPPGNARRSGEPRRSRSRSSARARRVAGPQGTAAPRGARYVFTG